MSQRFEGHFRGSDQNDLFFQTWTPEKVRGTFIITHGLAEHSECYHPLAHILADDGWQVFGWDMRGHGRSEGKRGFVRDIKSFVEDYACFVRVVKKQSPDFTPVLFGHSLGGLVTIRHVEQENPQIAALALSSPCLGLSMPVPKHKELLAKFAVNWMPQLTMFNEIKYTDLTHDPEMLKSYAKDSLRHDKISPGLFLTMVENFPKAVEGASEISLPVLMQLAGEDRLVSTAASRALYDRLPGKKNQLIVYPESFHEIFNDLDRDKAAADLKKFINPFLGV